MKFVYRLIVAAVLAVCLNATAAVTNPQAVKDLLNRVGGAGTADRIVTVLDESLAANGQETFVITSQGGKPCVKGSTLSALTTGLGWYLNHYAHVNLTWNNMTDNLSSVEFPVPAASDEHHSAAQYRYYLNYCTVSYSMSTWTWERWQQEIDWMALRGINMPLQIVGAEEVWRKFLMEDCGYTKDEVNAFVPGPAYVAWWGMANLEGAGGPNPDWWYERQAKVGKQIVERMRELGIEPVLPGFYMVPSTFTAKTGLKSFATGKWCGFTRPNYPDGADANFAAYAAKYYARLHEVLGGPAKYYSMDPYHEGSGNATVTDADNLYPAIHAAMKKASPGAKHVIQSWQWNPCQWRSIQKEPVGDLIVLDLYSDGKPGWGNYGNHDVVYSTIFNFGARTGFFGRFNGIIDGYFNAKSSKSTVKGIGAAPEGIEQTPVMYDLLFELPWHATKPNAAAWMADYAQSRYGVKNADAAECWELLRTSALDCQTSLQGPHEAVMCGRPALNINKVSSWGGSEIFYDTSITAAAVYKLLNSKLSGQNYSYDLTDLTRQALTDYSKSLLAELNAANSAGDTERFNAARDAFLGLMLDIDELLNTNALFMLGHWTELSRGMAYEQGGSEADADALEANNARQLITTWGPQAQAEGGGLRDYSYRQWGGILKDFYYQRWKQWFDGGMKIPSGGWFQWEWNWAHNLTRRYPTEPTGDTREVAERILPKYLSPFTPAIDGAEPYYVARMLTTDRRGLTFDVAKRDVAYTPDFRVSGTTIKEIAIDFSNNKRFDASEISAGASFAIPANAAIGDHDARITLADGTVLHYTVQVIEEITEPRTVSVKTADASMGTVSIEGATGTSVSNMETVVIRATAKPSYEFDYWTNAAGENVGNDNPYRYMGRAAETFTAHFVINKWGVPETDPSDNGAGGAIASNKQWVTSLKVLQNGEETEYYSAPTKPDEQFIYISKRIKAAPGGEFTFKYEGDKAGFAYLFLSAYMDKNIDGKFDMTTDELLGSIGTYQQQNQNVGNGSFTVLMPYDCTKGTTHIRLRFDSAWNNLYNATYKAIPADAKTNRFIYELVLDVQDSPEYVCQVSVASSDAALGSVRSENASNLYDPGEEVILTAFPNPGVTLKGWKDNHGRWMPSEWMTDNSINFKAFDNAQITAVFEKQPMVAGDWEFEWEGMDNGLARITGIIKKGTDGHLDLSNAVPAVGAINADVFAGDNGYLQEVTLPDTQLVGPGATIFTTEVKGDGTTNKQYAVSPTVSGSSSWTMTLKGSSNGATYNEWGSALYANGTNGLATDYSGGWSQLYLRADGTLDVKWDSGTAINFPDVNLVGDFTIRIAFDATAKQSVFTVSNGSGQSQTKTIANSSTMQEVSKFVTNIPAGISYTITFTKADEAVVPGTLFRNCSALTDFHCPEGSTLYTEKGGILYKKGTSRVWAYPEGRLSLQFVLRSGTSYVTNEGTVSSAANLFTALWKYDGKTFRHCNSNVKLNGADELTYELTYGSGMPSIKIGTTTYKFDDYLRPTFTSFPAVLVCPNDMYVFNDGDVWVVSDIDAEKGLVFSPAQANTVIQSPTPMVIRANHSGSVTLQAVSHWDDCTEHPDQLLKGTLTGGKFPWDTFVYDGKGSFVRTAADTMIAPNSALFEAADVPAALGDSFALDSENSSISEIESERSDATLYDLQGRRVVNPTRGLYITPAGQKIMIRRNGRE